MADAKKTFFHKTTGMLKIVLFITFILLIINPISAPAVPMDSSYGANSGLEIGSLKPVFWIFTINNTDIPLWNSDGTSKKIRRNSIPTPIPTPSVITTPAPAPIPVISQAYFVAMNGNDNNPGSEAQPWRTITKAANTAVAGNTVYVKAGTYNEQLKIANSGAKDKYITFTAYPGHVVTIDGTGLDFPDWQEGLIHISDKSYIKISGFRVAHSNNEGIRFNNASYLIIDNNYIYDVFRSAISSGFGNSNIVISNNTVNRTWRSDWGMRQGNFSGWVEAVPLSDVNTLIVRDNHIVRNVNGEGINVKLGSRYAKVYNNHVENTSHVGIYIDAWDRYTHDIDIFNNVVHDIASTAIAVGSEYGGTNENIRIYNNIIYNNARDGIGIFDYAWQGGPGHGSLRNISIMNNVIYNNGLKPDIANGGIFVIDTAVQKVVIRNNILSKNQEYQIMTPSGSAEVTVDHNLVEGHVDWDWGTWKTTRGADYVSGDPQFINVANADFHLNKTSPAIDNGSSINAPNVDFDGNSRPQGAGYDIGALEYVP